jgi:hypothetical protein
MYIQELQFQLEGSNCNSNGLAIGMRDRNADFFHASLLGSIGGITVELGNC